MSQATENIGLVWDALQSVFSDRRLDQIDRFFAADFVQHSPYAAPGVRDELRRWWADVVAAIPDVTTTVEDVVAADDRVAVFRVVRGTVRGELPGFGIVGGGQHVEFRTADIFKLRDGRIVAHWEVADTGHVVRLADEGGGRLDAIPTSSR